MTISESNYKDTFALELQGQNFTALVLPYDGGKLASFKDADGEEFLLQNPSLRYLHLGRTDAYTKGECSGFDDMFPTIDAVTFRDRGRKYTYPDHGEIARAAFVYEVMGGDTLVLHRAFSMGYVYKKTLREEDGMLAVYYEISNNTQDDLPVLWAGHCLIKAEQGGEVGVPYEEGELVDVMFDTSGVYRARERVPYKREQLLSVWDADKGGCNKFYFPEQVKEGYMSYRYPRGKEFTMRFCEQVLKYMGIWQNFGYLNGAYCIGLEPSTVAYDTVVNAGAYGQDGRLKKGETLKFYVKIAVRNA